VTITFTFRHPDADLEQIRAVVDQLRQKAIDLGLTGVGGLVCLNDDEIGTHEFGERFKLADESITPILPMAVCYFDGKLPDGEAIEIGLALYEMLDGWTWSGIVQSRDMKTVGLLMETAAELRIEATMYCGGMFFRHWRDESGQVQYEQDWAVDWDNF
jgi:hypothetical protein